VTGVQTCALPISLEEKNHMYDKEILQIKEDIASKYIEERK
jgi:hypothetical protein